MKESKEELVIIGIDAADAEKARPVALKDMMEAGMFIPNELNN